MKVFKGYFVILFCTLTNGSLKHAYESLQWGQRLVGRLLTTIAQVSPLDCAEECLVRPGCLSFNYRRAAIFCELNYENDTSSDTRLTNEDGWIFGRWESWPMEMTQECQKRECALNEKCTIVLHSPHCSAAQCHPSFLSPPQNVKNFSSDIALDFGSKHKLSCLEGYKQIGDGVATCLWDGTWSDVNLTCQEIQKTSCYYNYSDVPTLEDGYTWEEAKGKCAELKGYPVEIDSKEEFQFLYETFINAPGSNFIAWIGLAHTADKNVFKWQHSQKTISKDMLIAYGFPFKDTPGANKKCFILNKKEIKNIECSWNFNYLCELDAC